MTEFGKCSAAAFLTANVLVNGRPLLAGPFHLELGGNVTTS